MANKESSLSAISYYNEAAGLLTQAEHANLQAQLWALLARQTKLFTMGESSSVPVETAQELLKSIYFCIGIHLKNHPSKSSLHLQEIALEDLFAAGARDVWALAAEGKSLLDIATKTALDIDNISYHDTLREISGSFKHYDIRFFAHDIPCMIDYQLSQAVPDELLGMEYINEYLRRLIIENRFCRCFQTDRIVPLLKVYCPDYKGLLINIFEPVLTNAIGLALLCKDVLSLEITDEDRAQLIKLFRPWNGEAIEQSMRHAVNRICTILEIWDTQTRTYLQKSGSNLLHQIRITSPDSLHNLFLPLPKS